MILNKVPDDIDNPHKIRNLIDGLKDLREKKIKSCMQYKAGFKITNITMFEANKFRKFLSMLNKSVQSVESK